jgi:ribosomal protein S11
MSYSNRIQFSLNNFFTILHLKKQYFNKLKIKAHLLDRLKKTNYKKVGLRSSNISLNLYNPPFVTYILEISFSKKNTLFHLSDYSGNIKFFYSAGFAGLTGKGKTWRAPILRKFYKLLLSKLKFVRKVPLAVYFKNTGSNRNLSWFIRKLKKKFLITIIQSSDNCPYNGCRNKKVRRKKFKSRLFFTL